MISFVWSAKQPFLAGRGGSENYTAGHIRELRRRGIHARVLTLGFGENDGRSDFPDIEFKALDSVTELSNLDDTLVFVTYPLKVPTKKQSYAILHCPMQRLDPPLDPEAVPGKRLITPSRFAARLWGDALQIPHGDIAVVHPFAEACFSQVTRPTRAPGERPRILFAGRLVPDKGVYTLLAALHMDSLKGIGFDLTATDAASDTADGQIIKKLLEAHPRVDLIPARKTPEQMAQLMAEHDVVVMPTTNLFWQEIFGIVSVEAQHAGCRVVASHSGGLPETDCGGAIFVKPDDPVALADGIAQAILMGPLTETERMYASTKFTVQASVSSLLEVLEAGQREYAPLPSLGEQSERIREQWDAAMTTAIGGATPVGNGTGPMEVRITAPIPRAASRKVRSRGARRPEKLTRTVPHPPAPRTGLPASD